MNNACLDTKTGKGIKTFDYAVQSRIHYAIRFPPTSAEDQKKIFTDFINQIPDGDVDKESILDWINSSYMVDNQLCGRQIRNIISAAMAIARAKKRRLELEDIRMIWGSTKTFHDFVHAQRYRAEESALMRRGGYESAFP